eukprot:CCRYP_013582-RA/>CCRYP_013582-RA protein AED:0.56 eAED:0.40 QI:0/-1/0/1/-1/1/1/0/562
MAKYSFEAVQALLAPIPAIQGRPTFGSLWKLAQAIFETLQKLDNKDYPDTGYAGYMMPPQYFRLFSTRIWTDPTDVGESFVLDRSLITETDQKTAYNKWVADVTKYETFRAVRGALKDMFERVIDKPFHSSATATSMGLRGFGNDEPPDILARLQRLYGQPGLHEVEQNYKKLHEPMDRTLPPEMMIRGMEEIQIFLAQDPEGNKELSDATLIQFALIKLSKSGLYAKAIERWNAKDIADRSTWTDFKQHIISEYERMLREGGGSTFGQEGYGAAYHTMETDDTSSLAESIVQYAERATMAESKVAALEDRLANIEQNQMAMHSQGTFANEYAYFTPQPPTFQPPPTVQYPPQQATSAHQQQWTNQQPQQPRKRNKRDYTGNTTQFGGSPNVFVPQYTPTPPQYQQPQYGQGGRGAGGRGGGGRRNNNNKNAPFSNTQKRHMNLFYCFTCGYDVDHEGHQCPVGVPGHHMPQVKRNEAHLYANQGACMKGQHKTLPDGTGAGQGWILAQSVTKAQWTMQQQRQPYPQGHHNSWQRGQPQNSWAGQNNQWGGQQGYQNHWKQS